MGRRGAQGGEGDGAEGADPKYANHASVRGEHIVSDEIIKDHEHRIRYLEGRMWLIFGGLALLAAEIPIALKFFR